MGRWLVFSILFFSVAFAGLVYYTASNRPKITSNVEQEISIEFRQFLIKKNNGQQQLTLPELKSFALDLNKPITVILDKELLSFQFTKPVSAQPDLHPSKDILLAFQKQLFSLAQEWAYLKFPKDKQKIELKVEF